jgi:hypothetical protein
MRRCARAVAEACDPDGTLDERPDIDKVELHIGTRNPNTGMTKFVGTSTTRVWNCSTSPSRACPPPGSSPTAAKTDARPRSGRARPSKRCCDCSLTTAMPPPMVGNALPRRDLLGTVTMRYDDLQKRIEAAVLSYGGPISAAEARRIACDADIIPAVLGSDSEVLDIGRASRLFTPPIRKALELRDKGCAFPGCDRPIAWCDAHHVVHWVHFGETAYGNGCLLCRFHHSEVHKGHWTIVFAPDGIPEFIPPPWVDRDRKPRRNTANHLTSLLRS